MKTVTVQDVLVSHSSGCGRKTLACLCVLACYYLCITHLKSCMEDDRMCVCVQRVC